jgi:hypothetical protein
MKATLEQSWEVSQLVKEMNWSQSQEVKVHQGGSCWGVEENEEGRVNQGGSCWEV